MIGFIIYISVYTKLYPLNKQLFVMMTAVFHISTQKFLYSALF